MNYPLFRDMFHSGIYSAFRTDAKRFSGLNVGPTSRFNKIGSMGNSFVSVIHSHQEQCRYTKKLNQMKIEDVVDPITNRWVCF